MRVHVAADAGEFARRAADVVIDVVQGYPAAAIGLPSGETPLGLYDEIVRRAGAGEADLGRVTAFAIDELYGLPASHVATNAAYFRSHLSGRVTFAALHTLDSEATDPRAAGERFLRLIAAAGGLDLSVLGIGRNGHIAFNEPGSPFDSRARLVALAPETREAFVEACGSLAATPTHGLTLGVGDLLDARRVLLLAAGAAKAEFVAKALEGPITEALPASALQRHRELTVVLDAEAAAHLSHR